MLDSRNNNEVYNPYNEVYNPYNEVYNPYNEVYNPYKEVYNPLYTYCNNNYITVIIHCIYKERERMRQRDKYI